MKRCLTLLVIKEMQIKTTMRYNLKPVRKAIDNNNNKKRHVLARTEKSDLLHKVGVSVEWYSHNGKSKGVL